MAVSGLYLVFLVGAVTLLVTEAQQLCSCIEAHGPATVPVYASTTGNEIIGKLYRLDCLPVLPGGCAGGWCHVQFQEYTDAFVPQSRVSKPQQCTHSEWGRNTTVSALTTGCVDCICSVESRGGSVAGCGTIKGSCDGHAGCVMDVGSCSCGPFQIKQDYFTDCSARASLPIKDWVGCATNENCARQCVMSYLTRYGKYCTGKELSKISCEDFGRIHNGGPKGCQSSSTLSYAAKIKNCCSKNPC